MPLFNVIFNVRVVVSPEGAPSWRPGPAGCCVEARGRDEPHPDGRRAAAIGSCDVINTGKWLLPAQSRRRHRGKQAGAQAG